MSIHSLAALYVQHTGAFLCTISDATIALGIIFMVELDAVFDPKKGLELGE